MKQYFTKQENNKSLILFFTGWGMDQNTLSINKKDFDTCICFDYTDIDFEKSHYKNYQAIDVYGWSHLILYRIVTYLFGKVSQ